MAKGIEINGQLRGKRGGVVYYRAGGQQISRVRNFAPKNPNSKGQLLQRAITATVMQMYSYGKAIFNHSFQGRPVGAENQRRFSKLNMDKLRVAYDADVREGMEYDDAEARFVMRGAVAPTGNSYIISEGTYRQPRLVLTRKAVGNNDIIVATLPNVEITAGTTTINDYIEALQVKPGDIETLCVLVGGAPTGVALSADVSPTVAEFAYIQLKVREDLDLSATLTAASTVGDIFAVYGSTLRTSNVAGILNTTLTAAMDTANGFVTSSLMSGDTSLMLLCAGVIASREDSGERSNSTMRMYNQGKWGLWYENLYANWSKETGSSNSELVLEGGNF